MLGTIRFLAGGVIAGLLFSCSTIEAQSHVPDDHQRELFSVDVGELVDEFGVSNIVSDPPIIAASFYQMDAPPRVVVPRGSEAYLLSPNNPNNDFRGYKIIGSKPIGKSISGQFYTLRRHPDQPRESVLAKFEFRVKARVKTSPSEKEFSRARGRFYQHLWSEEHAGSAMFRHLATTSLKELGETAKSSGPRWPLRRRSGVDSTIAMMSGGRAVSENLQLDQQLAIPDADSSGLKSLDSVRGVQVRPVEWDDLLQNVDTELDPLAKIIPEDQYAIFVPSFTMFDKLVQRGGELAKPAVQWFEPQGRQRDALKFYQQQLGLSLNTLTRQVGKQLIGEIAITGSDSYFRTGTDIAILLNSNQPELLYQSVSTMVGAASHGTAGVKQITHRIDHHQFDQWSTPDRTFCSTVVRFGDTVVISNSITQVKEILRCADGAGKTIAELDEYRFFRQQYPRGDELDSALVVVTDAAIRKWCGPKWRIAASRRTRARATIAELTARYADEIVRETLKGETSIHRVQGMPSIGSLSVSSKGVHSPVYGTLDFQTPIAEMEMAWATEEEIRLYEQWRTQYERKWERAFDPIALQLSLDKDAIHADLTVIPLIMRSSYRQYTRLVGNVRLRPDAGDPHKETLGEFSMALDTKSSLMQFARAMLMRNSPHIDPLEWIDESVTIYFDHDEEWIDRVNQRSPWEMSSDDMFRDMPVGFFIPSKDNFKMTAFVVAVRALLDQFAPNMIQWEQKEYKGFQYVSGTLINNRRSQDTQLQIFYVTTNRGLTISANRSVVQRVVERHLVEQQPDKSSNEDLDKRDPPNRKKTVGPQIKFEFTGGGWKLMTRSNSQNGLRRMNRIAWSNLPILNYLRSQYPDRDPIGVYEKLFGERLQDPSGGDYVWDKQLGTYVSTHHGYNLEPKAGPVVSPILEPDDRVKTTISFENGGLRATLDVR